MFERRLKIILVLLAVIIVVILSRAAQVQIVQHDAWKAKAVEALTLTHMVEAPRGRILDRKGRVLAVDTPCIDACIEYRALTSPPDPDWVKKKAEERLIIRLGDHWNKPLTSTQVAALRKQEIEAVKGDIESMWDRLAAVSGRPIEEIDQTREAIINKVEGRQRYVWHKHYAKALNKEGDKIESPGWKDWIIDGGDSEADDSVYSITVAEQLEAHVILPAVSPDVQNELGKNIDLYPGLVLRPGLHRTYPFDDVACHVLGHLAHVDDHDLHSTKGQDQLRRYERNDLVGKSGVEWLCEPALRGMRGLTERVQGEDAIIAGKEPAAGNDVRLSIDIELQQAIQSAFVSAVFRDARTGAPVPQEEHVLLHGAAVVLDIDTNEVLALVSYPTYDENHFDELYQSLHDDEVNESLINRATMAQREPGSTMKPYCGLAGITQGVIGVHDGIECTGTLTIGREKFPYGACWVVSVMKQSFPDSKNLNFAHHPFPFPHVGHFGNPDGSLIYSEALERSCNVYFENVADRLGIERLSEWYKRFGFGRPTGIGIGEVSGLLPNSYPPHAGQAMRRSIGFFGGIGQGYIAVTPIQMANGAAMIARNGLWMRPHLLLPGFDGMIPATRVGDFQKIPDRVDLNLSPEAVVAARQGMYNVVNGDSGTGKGLIAGDPQLKDLNICGKTGTAQAPRFSVLMRDAAGKVMRDEETHKPKRRFLDPTTPGLPGEPDHLSTEAPWYRATDRDGKVIDHAWYMGFAPADHPKIAFAVMVEYGGSGGIAAASVAREAIKACMIRGYLPVPGESAKPVTLQQ